MKKLMTTISAAAMALSLSAVVAAPFNTGTSFEGLTAGEAYDITTTTGELAAEAGQVFWETNAQVQALNVKAGQSVDPTHRDDRNPAFRGSGNANYLEVKTTLGNPISRYITSNWEGLGWTGEEIGKGLYFDSYVRFTAFDGDAPGLSEGSKLAIWLKEEVDSNDNPIGTNLWVTAGYLVPGTMEGVVTTNYECTVGSGIDLNDGDWHRVTVKAISSIYKTGADRPGFVVFIDGALVSSTAPKGIEVANLNDNAAAFNASNDLFPSADQSSNARGNIRAVQFDGQGDVDELVFSNESPGTWADDKKFFTINFGENIASVEYQLSDDLISTVAYATVQIPWNDIEGKTVTILSATGSGDYVANLAGITVSGNVTASGTTFQPNEAESSITIPAKMAEAFVGTEKFGTLAEAVAYVNSNGGTLKLGSDVESAGVAFTGNNVILDLAGKTIAGTATDGTPTITVSSGSILITNSTENVGSVQAQYVDAGAGGSVLAYAVAVDEGNATATIWGGIFDGAIYVPASSIYGGVFTNVMDQTTMDGFVANGYQAILETVMGASYYGVFAVVPAPVVAEHPWYENPGAIVLAQDLPHQGPSDWVSAFHGQGSGNFLGLTYATNPTQFDLFGVDGTNALTTIHSVAAGDVENPGFRGVAISETLGVAMTLAYANTTTMYTFPLAPMVGGAGQKAVTKPSTHGFDSAAFSPDGNYLFSNAIKGEGDDSPAVLKWSVSVAADGTVELTKIGRKDASGRHRNLAYARINGRDLVFALAESGKVDVIDMTGDDTTAWTSATLLSNLPKISYGSLCVSGVNVEDGNGNPAIPHLTVATSANGSANGSGNNVTDVLNVYALTVPASGAVSASLVKSFDQTALKVAGFGDISDASRYGNTVYVTDDEKSIFFGRPDCKLYVGQYAVARNSTTLFTESLQEAVDGTPAGDTVTVLKDCSITTPLSIAKNLTIHNDYTITGAVNYAICIGATVSFEGSGKIQRADGITGSAFCVGANGGARGAVAGGTAGTLNFTGLTVCGGSGGNLIKLEKGTVNMNGGVLKDGLRGIKADADDGENTTSTIVINGGTITNCSACAVMASAESATGTATVTINGGEIAGALDDNAGGEKQKGIHTITIPSTSTAKFNADQSSFCVAGYETVLSDGWYVVQAIPSYTITFISGEGSTTNAQDYLRGLAPEPPTPATVANKTFTGWVPALETVTSNTTYNAQYEYTSYTITYCNGDGTQFTYFKAGATIPTTYTVENAVTLPGDDAIDMTGFVGGTFDCWTNAAGSTVTGWPAGGLSGDQTFYAQLKQVVETKYDAGSTTACESAAEATSLAQAINADKIGRINVPAVVTVGADYVALFEAVASGSSVTIDFTAAAAAAQTNAVDGVAAVAARAIPVAAAAKAATTFSPTGLTPGLWYSVLSGSAATSITIESDRKQAQADGTLGQETLTVPHPSNASGFFRIQVSPADKPTPPPNN